MIQAALFDYGGVMSTGGSGQELTDRLGKVLGVSGKQAYEYLGPYWHLYDTGKITEDTIWTGIEKSIGRQIPQDTRNIWNTWEDMQPLPEMVALVHKLQEASIVVGLLSNVIPNTKKEIRDHGGYEMFDFVVLSDEIGYAKPDREIYMHALKMLPNIVAQDIVFIDDHERFLTPAKDLGLKTILAASSQQIISEIDILIKL